MTLDVWSKVGFPTASRNMAKARVGLRRHLRREWRGGCQALLQRSAVLLASV